jgi:hypothetical protein
MVPSRRLLSVCALVLTGGCTGVWSRGIVQDPGTLAIGGAEVWALDEHGDRMLAVVRTDANGCFLITAKPPKGERRFTLEISAPGFRAARATLPLETEILIASLVPTSESAASGIHPATTAERSERWGPQCAPPMSPGAQQLSPGR